MKRNNSLNSHTSLKLSKSSMLVKVKEFPTLKPTKLFLDYARRVCMKHLSIKYAKSPKNTTQMCYQGSICRVRRTKTYFKSSRMLLRNVRIQLIGWWRYSSTLKQITSTNVRDNTIPSNKCLFLSSIKG